MAREIGEQLRAIRRVEHLGVELRAVIAPLVIGDQREGRPVAGGDDAEALGELRHLVAVAHPHLVPLADVPQAFEQYAGLGHGQEGAAEFAAFAGFVPRLHLAAQLGGHHLLAVTDAENREPRVEQHLRRARGALVAHAGRRSGQDDALGLYPFERLFGLGERRDLGIDARFAHAARDQLSHLAAEIDDKDGIGEMVWLHGRAVSAAPPPVQRVPQRCR